MIIISTSLHLKCSNHRFLMERTSHWLALTLSQSISSCCLFFYIVHRWKYARYTKNEKKHNDAQFNPETSLLGSVFTQWLQIFGGDTKVVVRAHLALVEWIQTDFPCRFTWGASFFHLLKYIWLFWTNKVFDLHKLIL